ncbi:MAG TPA: SAM-dependent methyltransferase [Acidimicrobiaceae bacterium]|nr:SAM-dependent methyltransferase [Acidimicrobiaceae bacterium]
MTSWMEIVAENPGHSSWYIERFRTMAANGDDLEGEARFVDAMVPRGARILDAGCGPGRVGGALHQRGHEVVGVDVDPALIEAAEQDHPGPTWLVGDLAELDLPSRGIAEAFDVIVCAGNVITFVPAADRRPALEHLGQHLADDGRIAIGFGDHRGYGFEEFRADVDAAGLSIELELSTWDIRPFRESSDFMVALLRR